MFGALDVSTSGLVAQRTRMNVISANLANRNAIEDSQGNYAPYRRRVPILAAESSEGSGQGVRVAEIMLDQSPLRKVYDKNHPYADKDGYVKYPNINTSTEMINAIEVTRAYEANITAAQATKSMIQASLRLLA